MKTVYEICKGCGNHTYTLSRDPAWQWVCRERGTDDCPYHLELLMMRQSNEGINSATDCE